MVYKVLIVEDDPMVAMIEEQYIKRHKSFDVVGKCSDGKAAIDFLEKNSVDLLILDVFMPNMNGFEALGKIRSRKIKVDAIMVTAADSREALEEALHLGVTDYLVKPFTFDRFQAALEKYIAQSSALSEIVVLNQTSIDRILDTTHKKGEDLFPKGIQEKTLLLIINYMHNHKGVWFNGDEIAEKIGLTGVTVRRYLNYLSDSGRAFSEMNYETGGRPSMRYKVE